MNYTERMNSNPDQFAGEIHEWWTALTDGLARLSADWLRRNPAPLAALRRLEDPAVLRALGMTMAIIGLASVAPRIIEVLQATDWSSLLVHGALKLAGWL